MMSAEQCVRRAFEANLRGEFDAGDRWSALARNMIAAELRVLETGDVRQMLGAPILLPELSIKNSWWG